MNNNNNNVLKELFGNDLGDMDLGRGSQGLYIAPHSASKIDRTFDTGWQAWWQSSEEAKTYRDDEKDQSTKPSECQQPEASGFGAIEAQTAPQPTEVENEEGISSGHQAAIGNNPTQSTTGGQFWDFSLPEVKASMTDINQGNNEFDRFVGQMLANSTQEVSADLTAANNDLFSDLLAEVAPPNAEADPLDENPGTMLPLDDTAMPTMGFDNTAIIPNSLGNLGIGPMTFGLPNQVPEIAIEQPAPNCIEQALTQSQEPKGIQPRRKKLSRSQQKAHFEAMGVQVGYEFKRNGEVRVNNGQLYWLDPQDTWKPAVYHVDLREKFLRMTDAQGSYTHPPAQGGSALDRTSFFAPQRDWGFQAREYRPEVLFQWDEVESPEALHPGFMMDQGRIVLDSNNHPVVNWDIPLTLSSEVEGGRLEAMHRLNGKINKDDFCARMPNERVITNGEVIKRQIPNAFGQRMLRFRMRAGIPTWNTKTGSDEVRSRIIECIPAETLNQILQTNSTRCFRDLSDKELLYVEKGNAGKAVSRAGAHQLPQEERRRRFKKKYASLNGWNPPNKRPWSQDFSQNINKPRKRSERGCSTRDPEPSGSNSYSPSEWQGSDFSRDTAGYGHGSSQVLEEKENIPPARRGAPHLHRHAKNTAKDQRRSNEQTTPYSQAQRALNDHLPVQNSDFWQYASTDQNQRKRLHSTTGNYDYARDLSKEFDPEKAIEVSPYNQRHGFKIYVPQESMITRNDMNKSDMSYGQPHTVMLPSESSRKRKVDEAFSQDETRCPDDLVPAPKRPTVQRQQTPSISTTDSNPPNEGDGRYDDPENYDEVRSIQSALSNTWNEVCQRLGYTPEIETCQNHSYIRQFNQIESWFKSNWKGAKAAPKLTTMEKPWKGGIPAPEDLFLGYLSQPLPQ
ncbi:MAG: hypothetical protein Q9167_002157 [Letrouitia subvulpina]